MMVDRRWLVLVLAVTMMVVTGEDSGDTAGKEEEVEAEECEDAVDCRLLLPGQALCLELDVDPGTQQLRGCQQVDGAARALQRCTAIGKHCFVSYCLLYIDFVCSLMT